ncbi:hypothetical protein CA234_12635 [Sphingomonas sp. ABOLE]|uniref:hypothetical protein n=1 Tax=Sphingomonas sp. ABOLE TaxID=1985878 RepID=UPI000F7E37AB|nr:hypothetical protein [Sphingomonas sp. ABOLE]RSV40105.1 hypothetical protein CA234_12635 [Sphingomonas sp. ABOLE]
MPRFVDSMASREGRFALGTDMVSGQPYLSIPVSNRLADYEEYYRLTDSERVVFESDMVLAAAFAAKCRRREIDDRLILPPGADRGN